MSVAAFRAEAWAFDVEAVAAAVADVGVDEDMARASARRDADADADAETEAGAEAHAGAKEEAGVAAVASALPMAVATERSPSIVAMPIGGAAISLGRHRVICGAPSAAARAEGWFWQSGGHRLRPPPKGIASQVGVHLAADLAACGRHAAMATFVAVAWPRVDAGAIVHSVDAGRIDVRGHALKNVRMTWRSGTHHGSDVCDAPQAEADGQESCAFTIDRALLADVGQVSLLFLPAAVWGPGGAPAMGEKGWALPNGLVVFDASGRPLDVAHLAVAPAQAVVSSLLDADASIDTDVDEARLPLRHPEAVGEVSCVDASCELDGTHVVVRQEHGADDTLELRFGLRPHVRWQGAATQTTVAVLELPVQRCPLALASAAPLRGLPGQQAVVKVGGRCQNEPSLHFFVGGSAASVVTTHRQVDGLYAVLRLEGAPSDEVSITMQRGRSIVGSCRAPTRAMMAAHVGLEIPGYGAIDFIPSNRDATIVLPPAGAGTTFVPQPVAGVYTVQAQAPGAYRARGEAGTHGWVAMRLALRDTSLPPPLRALNLAELTDNVERNIRPASVPIALGTQALGEAPLLELTCGTGHGHVQPIPPAQPTQVPFTARESCRLILHRERLNPEDGDQALRVAVTVIGLDGLTRNEANVDQRVVLKPGAEPRIMAINGIIAPFDRVIVRVSLMADDARYAMAADDKLNAPQVQWSVTMGVSKLRLFATAALPTGLFRVASQKQHSGLYGLNAGVLLRLVGLTAEGQQTPVGLEGGVMVVGITGDTTPAPNGQVALVSGLSVSIPIANWGKLSQAAISLHIWAEYEISRAFGSPQAGSPWGFIFGPSISLGDVGYNL